MLRPSSVVSTDGLVAALLEQRILEVTTPPATTPSIEPHDEVNSISEPKFKAITIDRLAQNCAKDVAEVSWLKKQIEKCHNRVANDCAEFEVIFRCLSDIKDNQCHLFDMSSFESDVHAHLIENYKDSSIEEECVTYENLYGNIFQTSTNLCSQNYIDEEKRRKQECSTVEEHILILQVRFPSR